MQEHLTDKLISALYHINNLGIEGMISFSQDPKFEDHFYEELDLLKAYSPSDSLGQLIDLYLLTPYVEPKSFESEIASGILQDYVFDPHRISLYAKASAHISQCHSCLERYTSFAADDSSPISLVCEKLDTPEVKGLPSILSSFDFLNLLSAKVKA
ncbi:MAG: hypothetical protein ISS01_02105 [Nanoarchaeota archaeon]|nr:hypothetical protein [Nanoarchaeota archaeon]